MGNFLNFAGNQGMTFKNHGTGGGTSFTLDVAASTNSVLLTVGGVMQAPGTDYTVSGTTVTTTTSVTAGIEVLSWVIHKPGTAPVIQDNSVTGPKIALTSQAEGDIMYCNASGDWVRLAKGTAGQVLAQNSGLTAPEWVGATGGWTPISTGSPSAVTSFEITSGIDGTYDCYMIEGIVDLSTDAQDMAMQLSDDAGVTYHTGADYNTCSYGYSANNQTKTHNNSAGNSFKIVRNQDVDVAMKSWFRVILLNPNDTGDWKMVETSALVYDNTTTNSFTRYFGGGALDTGNPVTNTVTAVKFNISTGTVTGDYWLSGYSRT